MGLWKNNNVLENVLNVFTVNNGMPIEHVLILWIYVKYPSGEDPIETF